MNNPGTYSYTHPSGKKVLQYELRNAKGSSVGITNFGAIINYFRIKKGNGEINDIVHGFLDLEEYNGSVYLAGYPWFGCVVGRYANRVRNARFELEGQPYHLTQNKGVHQLHGGPGGFDRRVWDFKNCGNDETAWLELDYFSRDGEEGYPGNLNVTVRYELNDQDELSYELRATTDKTTPVNLTHHSYFNLNNNRGTIHDHVVILHASRMLDQDEDLVVTGGISNVLGTAYDFRMRKRIGDGLLEVPEYDKSFIRDQEGFGLAAEAFSPDSNMGLQVFTTEPILHFYTGKWTPIVQGKDGIEYGPFSGFCFETHRYPNAVNISEFPSTLLKEGELYYHKTVYRVFET